MINRTSRTVEQWLRLYEEYDPAKYDASARRLVGIFEKHQNDQELMQFAFNWLSMIGKPRPEEIGGRYTARECADKAREFLKHALAYDPLTTR